MRHDKAITLLKAYSKRRLLKSDPTKLSANIARESDRAAVILLASIIEDVLTERIEAAMDTLNSDEKSRLFQFEGVLGTFSSRIKIAQAIGIVTRTRAKVLDVIRELRNACAHAQEVTNFDAPVFKEAAALVFPPTSREELKALDAAGFRSAFAFSMIGLAESISDPNFTLEDFNQRLRDTELHNASLYGFWEASG